MLLRICSLQFTGNPVKKLLHNTKIFFTFVNFDKLFTSQHCINEGETDSALFIVGNEDTNWAKEREVEIYYTTGDYKSALEKLDAMPGDEQNSIDFKTLYGVHIDIAEDGRNILSLTEAELDVIESLAGKQSPSGIAGENILQFITGIDYPEVFDPEIEEEKRMAQPASQSNLLIYPNPTNNELFIQIENAVSDDEYVLYLYDITGSLINRIVLQSSTLNQIQLSNYSTGIYVARIDENNAIKRIEKIIKN